jgi:hypothetical protein
MLRVCDRELDKDLVLLVLIRDNFTLRSPPKLRPEVRVPKRKHYGLGQGPPCLLRYREAQVKHAAIHHLDELTGVHVIGAISLETDVA